VTVCFSINFSSTTTDNNYNSYYIVSAYVFPCTTLLGVHTNNYYGICSVIFLQVLFLVGLLTSSSLICKFMHIITNTWQCVIFTPVDIQETKKLGYTFINDNT
jgi:general stress protein CsbA